ncbi:hypothetical protein PG1C_12860 [Rugosibacter aromaticivorans]|uniref:Uncharacterized protein n=1 Tax=Rugosibacter aromaticivorans TaxID=1565605 RepID=A0A0C5JB99_9PROT|nr:hypothetical protein PG1C_12860 [Rugosibacter aromaticivorans]
MHPVEQNAPLHSVESVRGSVDENQRFTHNFCSTRGVVRRLHLGLLFLLKMMPQRMNTVFLNNFKNQLGRNGLVSA